MNDQNSGGIHSPKVSPSGISHSFDSGIAKQLGLAPAIIYNYFAYWMDQNKSQGINFHEGRYWVYNTIKALSGIIPYLTEKQIRDAIDKLIGSGLLLKGSFNKNHFDRKMWYTLSQVGLAHLPSRANACAPQGKSDLPSRANVIYTSVEAYEDSPKGEAPPPLLPSPPLSSLPPKAVPQGNRPKRPSMLEKHPFRENVLLSPSEYTKLLEEVGEQQLEWMLDKLDATKASTGRRYISDASTMRKGGWVRDAYTSQRKPTAAGGRQASRLRAGDTGEYSNPKLWEENEKKGLELLKKDAEEARRKRQ